MIDVILWYLLLSLVGWLALPLAFQLFGRLPDKGYALSRALGLLLWGFIFWMLASLQVVPNEPGGMIFALILIGGISGWQLRGDRWKDFWSWIKEQKTLIFSVEVVFFIAFWFWVLVRAANPEILGTEKPMEMAFINAILRSPTFPPNDPWLSGYSISYYYFGYVLVAMLTSLTGVAGSVAFNLAVAMCFGLTAVTAYGLVYSLLRLGAGREKDGEKRAGILTERSSRWWAAAGPVFVLIISNLEGIFEVLHSAGIFWRKGEDGVLSSSFWQWLNLQELVNAPVAPFSLVPERIGGIWWWRASRVLQDINLAGRSFEIIDEFPFFSYLLADLHPHVLAMPFVLLAMGMALNIFLAGNKFIPSDSVNLLDWGLAWLRDKRLPSDKVTLVAWITRSQFWFAVIGIGGLAFFNTWDFPFYIALFSSAHILAVSMKEGFSLRRIIAFFELCVLLGVMGILAYLPFYAGFASQAGGILPSLSFFTRGIYFWIMFAPLLLPIFAWLIWLWLSHRLEPVWRAGWKFALGVVGFLWLFSYLLGWIGSNFVIWGSRFQSGETTPPLAQRLIELGQLFNGLHGSSDPATLVFQSLGNRLASPVTWISLLILILLVWGMLAKLSRTQKSKGEGEQTAVERSDNAGEETANVTGFILLLVLVGGGLAIAPEFIYLRDNFGYRMNTIFKFYFQVWMLWGIAAAYASAILWQWIASGWRWGFRILWVVVIGAALIYPVFGLWDKTSGFSPTRMSSEGVRVPDWSLDGALYLERSSPDEMAAIAWLREAPLGVVAEAVGDAYSSYARVATFSGQPTVLGWANHEGQWRGGSKEMGTRDADIETLYRTNQWLVAEDIIKMYQIRYIFIGSLENSTYRVSETKFQSKLKLVYEHNGVKIYEVPDDILD